MEDEAALDVPNEGHTVVLAHLRPAIIYLVVDSVSRLLIITASMQMTVPNWEGMQGQLDKVNDLVHNNMPQDALALLRDTLQ